MDPASLILIALMSFLVVGGLGFVFAGGERSAATSKRVIAVAGGRSAEKPRTRSAAEVAGVRRKQILQTLKQAEKQERKAKLTIEARLRQAGLKWSVKSFWIGSGALGGMVFLLLLVVRAGPLAALGASFA